EEDGSIEGLRWGRGRVAGPHGTHAPGEVLAFLVTIAGKRIDLFTLIAGNLDEDMRRSTEAIDAQPMDVVADKRIGAVADKACTKQGCTTRIGVSVHQGKTEFGKGDRIFRIAAVDSIAGEAGI